MCVYACVVRVRVRLFVPNTRRWQVFNEAYLDVPRAVDWGGPRQWEYDPELDPTYRIPRAFLDLYDERPDFWRQRVWWRGPKGAEDDPVYMQQLEQVMCAYICAFVTFIFNIQRCLLIMCVC